jgi:hypothetical protein
VAPTLDPQELDKRIDELRTVQFWLEQNARMLGTTIQAMEVQRMTLSTLKSMNVSMDGLRDAMTIKMPDVSAPAGEDEPDTDAEEPAAEAAAPTPPVVDPMQWWGALTQQFTELATQAMKDTTADAAKQLATQMVKQSFDAAGETLKKAVAMPASVAQKAANAAGAVTAAAVGAAVRTGTATRAPARKSSKTGSAAPAKRKTASATPASARKTARKSSR